jgi:LCP family protein required for cell wall assembly
MQAGTDPRPRARSPFVAAFLSLLFPGLGHAYAGAYQRALAFAALPVLLLALTLGIVLRVTAFDIAGFLALPPVLPGIFVLNLIALAYRAVAIIDAWRVTHFLNAWMASGDGRLGLPRVPLGAISVAGMLAVVLVMSGVHVAVARYDLLGISFFNCVFPPYDCPAASASPSPTRSEEPVETEDPEPTLSLPPEGSALPDVTAPPWNGTERLNILLIGSDEQGGGHNTDTLIVLSIDPVSKQVAMFTLPRDAVGVPVPAGPARNILGPVYNRKINSLFVTARNRADLFPGTQATRGYNALKGVLGELYGLDVKYFVEVNFEGFTRVVDALGGVTINVQIPLLDDRFPDERGRLKRIYIAAGVQHMTGEEALTYARSRSSSSDYERGQRQQRVLLSLRESVDIARVLPRVNELAAALASAVRTDIPRELVPQLLGLAEAIDTRTLRAYVFAPPRFGRDAQVPGLGFVLQIDVARIRAAVAEAFVVDPELEERREALATEAGTVWVLNGSGVEGQAARISGYLDHQGFTVSAPNQRPDQTGLPATRIVVYNGAESRLPDTIAALEEIFDVEVVPTADPAVRVDIIITTGRQTPDLTPPPAP